MSVAVLTLDHTQHVDYVEADKIGKSMKARCVYVTIECAIYLTHITV